MVSNARKVSCHVFEELGLAILFYLLGRFVASSTVEPNAPAPGVLARFVLDALLDEFV